jgi:hypothetical protein
MQTSGNERRPDACLFVGMTEEQIEKFQDRVDNAATREGRHGNYALANDLDEVYHDLDGAWWRKQGAGQ